MTKPKVWHLASNRWNSAIAEYALQACRATYEAGFPSLLTPLAGKPLEKRGLDLGLDVQSLDNFKPKPATWRRLLTLKRSFQPDLIIVYGGPETFLSQWLPVSPAILRFRGQNEDVNIQRGFNLGPKRVAALLAPSQAVAAALRTSSKKPVYVVPLGCDTERFHYRSRAESGNQRPLLQIVGRLDPVKGHERFFYIFKELLRQWPADIRKPLLQVIGEPANISVEQLRASAQAAELIEGADWQLIDKRVPDIAVTMAQAHLGVICSLGSEVICRVAEEFLLCGTAVLVSGVGSLDECLFSSEAGSSYRGRDMHDTVRILKDRLLKTFQESEDDRQRRAVHAARYFSRQRMAERLSEVVGDFC